MKSNIRFPRTANPMKLSTRRSSERHMIFPATSDEPSRIRLEHKTDHKAMRTRKDLIFTIGKPLAAGYGCARSGRMRYPTPRTVSISESFSLSSFLRRR